jgi:signal transduction histidine kinase
MRVHPAVRANQLRHHAMADDVTVQINGTDLLQVLRNLIVNGLQCTSETHRVEVQGTVVSESVNVGSMRDGPECRFVNRDGFQKHAPLLALTVKDTGPGSRRKT